MIENKMIPFHPLANMFPLLEGKEFTDLITSIKKAGQYDPIIKHEEKILDGRNRYLACLEAGIEPRFEPLPAGQDPIEFVFHKNVIRRHLNPSQMAMAVATYATLKKGDVATQVNGRSGDRPLMSMERAAELGGISVCSVRRAKNVLTKGTPEEIAGVMSGKVAVKTVDENIRARVKKRKPEKEGTGSGYRSEVPAGFSCLTDAVRAGIEKERAGVHNKIAQKESGLGSHVYRIGRDVVLLLDRDDLSHEDMTIVRKAASDMDKTRAITRAAALVAPIALKVWGDRGNRLTSDKKRQEAFDTSLSFVITACTAVQAVEIPHIGVQRRDNALKELEGAIIALRQLQLRIKGDVK